MKITQIQFDIKWNDPVANQQLVEAMILNAPKSDLYVLPEMWSTGFAVEPKGIAETNKSSLLWMQNMADRLDAAITGSIATYEGGKYFNRMYFVKPQEDVDKYDKHHLFSYGNEHQHYTAGTERTIVCWRGVRFLLQVCYDLRFPIFSRNTSNNPYDAIIYVASWPESRRKVWDILLKARAIENQSYIIAVNRIGTDPVCQYSGGTMLVDAYGRIADQCMDNVSSTITNELDIERQQSFRQKFPVLNDMDNALPI